MTNYRSQACCWSRGLVFLLLSAVGFGCFSMPLGFAEESTLAQRQAGVAGRYQRLEELLLRLADVEVTENPDRAALLRRAARQSRDQFVLEKIQDASESLKAQQYQDAVDNQGAAAEGLQNILKLLLSEDRSKRIRDEKERIAKLIKDLKRIERAQRSTRARTENDADLDQVQEEQSSLAERSDELKSRLSEDAEDQQRSSSDDQEREDSKQQDGSESESDSPEKSKDSEQSKDSEDNAGESKSSDSESSDSESKQSSESKSQQSESQPSQSQPSESQPSQSESSPSPQSPQQQAEQQLEQAIEKMRDAEEKLEQAKREQATEKQREAEENLRAAIDRLEQILRQLREEEMQRELARLEARLRKMAAMQSQVLDDTVTLAATPKSQRNRQTDLKAGDLAFEEKKITLEADRAMLLLREEGSSVAFPEVVSQICDDTVRVSERLGQSKIDAVTQGIQQDILAALEEMIDALQKAQRDLEKQRQQQQPQGSGQGSGEQPLVEALAELKLIRTMEKRVKSTTERYSALLDSGESTSGDVLPLLQGLSVRQNRLYRITRDLVLKRNN